MMCKKYIIVLALSFLLISSAGAATVTWDFENGNTHRFVFQSTYLAAVGIDDPNIAGDEAVTGAGGFAGLPEVGLAWTVGPPTQFDGLLPAADAGNARVGADGLLDYSLGTVRIDPNAGTLNTFNLNQHGDNIHIADNDQIASSPAIILEENAVLTAWSWGGGSGTHAPEYDPNPALWYTDGSSGIVVFSAAGEDDEYTILATLYLSGHGTRTEDTLDLSAFAGRKVQIDVVDAFAGSWGWLAVDEIQITNAIAPKLAGFICQLTEGELAWGFDQAQVDHLTLLGYEVMVIDFQDIGSEVFTKDDANALDVMIISESPNSNACDNLIGMTCPLMHQEAFAWDNYQFMGVRTNIRWLEDQTQVQVVNDTHPIMVDAGFPLGTLPWFTAPDQYTTEDINMMAPGAELLVKADTEEAAVVFVIEKGAELADGNECPNNTVGFSIAGNQDGNNQVYGIIDASIMTDEQWALYDAALRWLDPPAVEVPPMVAHWPMDDNADDVVGDNDGTILGNVSFVEGALGSAAVFAAEPNTAILVSDSPSIDFGDEDFSISMLLRYPVAPAATEEDILMKGTTGSPGIGSRYVLFTKGGNIRYEIDNGPVDIKSGQLNVPQTPVVTGEWVHLVVVRDSVNDLLSMYADGILIGTGADVSGDISSPGEDMRIGGSTMGDLINQVSCEMDDVRIFPSALTEAEIAAIY